ncbi:MAG: recombinase family protein [Planctomycetes bacterium]|nr:recombinase family protein [Planctomycetota bacterium]
MTTTEFTKAVLKLEAIFYGRFSSDKQTGNDSEPRQREAFARVLARYPDKLVASTRFKDGFFDKAKSAFKGKHITAGHLGELLSMAKAGKLENCAIVIDEISRFSRIEPDLATALISDTVRAGVVIVVNDSNLWIDIPFLSDSKYIYLQMLLQQAHEKSKTISRHVKEATARRREKKILTASCPHYLTLVNGAYQFNEQAEILRKAIQLSIDGMGCKAIWKHLGLQGHGWTGLSTILRKHHLFGEYTPRNLDGTIAGESDLRYTVNGKPLINELTFNRLQSALDSRCQKRGKIGKHCANLFTNLVRDDQNCPMIVRHNQRPGRAVRRFLRRKDFTGRQICNETFERAVLDYLKELEPSEVCPQDNDKQVELERIQGQIAKIDQEVNRFIEADLMDGAEAAKLINTQRRKKEKLKEELEEIKKQMTHNQGDELAEIKSLNDLLARTPEAEIFPLRVKIKSLIAGIIRRIYVSSTGTKEFNLTVRLHSGVVKMIEVDANGWHQLHLETLVDQRHLVDLLNPVNHWHRQHLDSLVNPDSLDCLVDQRHHGQRRQHRRLRYLLVQNKSLIKLVES